MATIVEGPFGPQHVESGADKPNGRRRPRPPGSDAKPQWEGEPDAQPAQGWLVKNVLPQHGVGLLAGQSQLFKTYIALDLTQAVILGPEFAGHAIEREGGVVLFAAEAPFQVRPRWEGLRRAKIAAKFEQRGETMKPMPFAWYSEVPQLTANDALARMMAYCSDISEAMRSRFECDLALIVIDTMSAAADFSDHNDAGEAQKVMNMLAQLSARTGALVLVVDHFGKDADRGVRGSSAKEASADFVLSVLGNKDPETGVASNLRMVVRKLRGGAGGLEMPFELTSVNMGEDVDGDVVTELAVQWHNDTRPRRRAANNKRLGTLLQALDEAILDVGKLTQPCVGYPTVMAVSADSIWQKFYKIYPPLSGGSVRAEGTIRKAFRRAMKDAADSKIIGSYRVDNGDELVWKVAADSNGQDTSNLLSVRPAVRVADTTTHTH